MLWIGAIIAIGLLIVVHEAGHFFVARWCKMRVDRFSVGFGPAIWSVERGGTQFQIAPIPFGGFVQINGMLVAEEVDPDDPYAYPNRPAWQRFLTIFAGPATNYLFAVVLALGLYQCAGVRSGTAWYEVYELTPDSAAAEQLKPGDRLLAINGEPLYFLRDWERGDINARVQKLKGQPLTITLLRNGQKLDVQVTPKPHPTVKTKSGEPQYLIGFKPSYRHERVDPGFFPSIGHALYYPIAQTKEIVAGLYKIIRGKEKGELTGPVGITHYIKESFKAGWITAIELLMILNVYLGLFNLFPLPALDGGRLVFLTYEMATRRRANPKVEATVHMVGIMALLVLMVLVTYKDIAKIF